MSRQKKNNEEDFEEENEGSKFSSLSEMAKKALMTGIGAIFMTEESIRNAMGDMKMPKDAVGFLIDQAKKQKDDLVAVVAHEVSNFLSKVKVHEEIQKALSNMQIHVDARLSFSPKGVLVSDKIKIEMEEKDED